MNNKELEFILNNIEENLKDLQTIFVHDQLSIDLECYQEIFSILDTANKDIITSINNYDLRHKQRVNGKILLIH